MNDPSGNILRWLEDTKLPKMTFDEWWEYYCYTYFGDTHFHATQQEYDARAVISRPQTLRTLPRPNPTEGRAKVDNDPMSLNYGTIVRERPTMQVASFPYETEGDAQVRGQIYQGFKSFQDSLKLSMPNSELSPRYQIIRFQHAHSRCMVEAGHLTIYWPALKFPNPDNLQVRQRRSLYYDDIMSMAGNKWYKVPINRPYLLPTISTTLPGECLDLFYHGNMGSVSFGFVDQLFNHYRRSWSMAQREDWVDMVLKATELCKKLIPDHADLTVTEQYRRGLPHFVLPQRSQCPLL